MVQQKPGRHHDSEPDQWEQDLNPNPTAGQNHGIQANRATRYDRTAYDIDELQQRLEGFNDEELGQIPVLKAGTRLQQGATYIDLNDPKREEFPGVGDMSVAEGDYVVPKSEVPYMLWNRLLGVKNSDRDEVS